jgi:hypothetical protein
MIIAFNEGRFEASENILASLYLLRSEESRLRKLACQIEAKEKKIPYKELFEKTYAI